MKISLQFYIKYSENARKSADIMRPNSSDFFHDFRSLLRICAHPWLVKNKSDMSDSDESESDSQSDEEGASGKSKNNSLINLVTDNSSEGSTSESDMETGN